MVSASSLVREQDPLKEWSIVTFEFHIRDHFSNVMNTSSCVQSDIGGVDFVYGGIFS